MLNHEIRPVVDRLEIRRFAELMSRSSPWRELGLHADYFVSDLELDCVDSFSVGVEGSPPVAYMAVVAHGLALEPLLEYMVVDEDHRRQGHGTRMVRHFEDVLFPNAKNLYMFVSDYNRPARSLYSDMGYSEVGALSDLDVVGASEILLRKTRGPKLGAMELRLP